MLLCTPISQAEEAQRLWSLLGSSSWFCPWGRQTVPAEGTLGTHCAEALPVCWSPWKLGGGPFSLRQPPLLKELSSFARRSRALPPGLSSLPAHLPGAPERDSPLRRGKDTQPGLRGWGRGDSTGKSRHPSATPT